MDTISPSAGQGAQRQALSSPRRDALRLAFAELLLPRNWARLRALLDVVFLGSAASAAVFASAELSNSGADTGWCAGLFPVVAFLVLRVRDSPDEGLSASLLDTLGHVTGMLAVSAMLTIAGDGLLGGSHPASLAVRLWTFSTVYVGASRAALVMVRRSAMRSSTYAEPVLIVGAGYVGQLLARRLAVEPRWGLRAVGFVDDSPRPRLDGEPLPLPLLGGLSDLPVALELCGARRVVVAFSGESDRALFEVLRECESHGVEVSVVPRLYEAINERASLDHLGGVPLVTLRPTDPRGWQFAVKHFLDRAVAVVGIALLSPLLALITLAVKLSSPGPVLFRQLRVGRDGHVFDLLKFRSMEIGPADETFVPTEGAAPGGVEGTDRRTPIGRFLRRSSLDELPQLINVLLGDMSLVGPRPERPEFVARFAGQHERYEDRHRVKSGITGWAQVNGLRGQTSIADRVEWDNWYIRNWALRLDVRILVLTVLAVLRAAE